MAFDGSPTDQLERCQECGHDQVAVFARRRLESGESSLEHVCLACDHRRWSEGYAPQEGPQSTYFACEADIAVYGGAAGAGKTFSIGVEPLRYCTVPGFSGFVFRRLSPQLFGGGSIWEQAREHYPRFGGTPARMMWRFPTGIANDAVLQFGHLQHEDDKYTHQGKSYCFIGFDELTHFTEGQFWYLLRSNRSMCGVKPYIRATCNPVHREHPVGGWVRDLIDWWIDDRTGLPIPGRSGVIRWFVRVDEQLCWGDSAEELSDQYPAEVYGAPKSFTFIAATIEDNAILRQVDPGYEANLMVLQKLERERQRYGNWNAAPSSGSYFDRSWFTMVEERPPFVLQRVRAWDLAASKPTEQNPDPDWTRGVLMSIDKKMRVYVEDIVSIRSSPGRVEELIRRTAEQDGRSVRQCFWQDPAQAGKSQKEHLRKLLIGYANSWELERKDKETYWSPLSSYAEAGHVSVVRADWNRPMFAELEALPEGAHKDIADAAARAFQELTAKGSALMRRAMEKR